MAFWVTLSEIIRNFGLVAAALVGICLAWKRVVASNKQADAQLRQADLSRRNHVTELFNRAVGQLKTKDSKFDLAQFGPSAKYVQIFATCRGLSFSC